jgi:spoIIIJ-associated protein
MSDSPESPFTTEATGETVGEAKWAALRELERRFPGLDKSRVHFAVVTEGERGLLGVGYAPARVVASVDPDAVEGGAAPQVVEASEPPEPGTLAAHLHELLVRIAAGVGCPAAVSIEEEEETITATLTGPDLGRLIGRHGQTIDAVQYLVNAVVQRQAREDSSERKVIVVDAAGYRARRRLTLDRAADRAAADALRSGRAVALDPMTAVERKIVHLRLAEREDVETASEGTEPNRHVVVRPV